MSRKKFIALSAVITALAVAAPFVCSEKLSETFYTISSHKITAPVKIAFLSDLHNTLYGYDMSELTDCVDRFEPDIVIIGGDLFDRHWDEKNSIRLAEKLAAKYPCFYALGNHEIHHGVQNKARQLISESGVNVLTLNNYSADIEVNGNIIRVLGFDGMEYEEQYEQVKRSVSDSQLDLLVYHFPEDYPQLSGDGYDLILAGHAHGGQIRIPGLLNGLYAPGQGLFPKYTSGEYRENGSCMIVSRGLQRSLHDLVVPRVFNRPEAVFITIMPE